MRGVKFGLSWNECVFISFQACKMCFNEGSSINGIRFVLIFWVGSMIMVSYAYGD